MVKFISVFGIFVVSITLITFLWPRFSTAPRPALLAQYYSFLVQTPAGKDADRVLGAQIDTTGGTLTPKGIVDGLIIKARDRVSDVLVTHLSRGIMSKFNTLPEDQKQRILNAFSQALSEESSPSGDLSDPAYNGSN